MLYTNNIFARTKLKLNYFFIMIKKIILLTTTFLSFSCFSQNTIKSTISEPIEHEAKFSKARGGYFQSSTLVSDNLGGFFMVKMNSQGAPVQKPKSYSIYHYDENLKLKSETEYLMKENSAFLGGVFISEGKINIIHKVNSKAAKKSYDFEVITSNFDSNEFSKNTLITLTKKSSFFRPSQENALISSSSPSGIFTSENQKFFSIVTKNTEKNNHKFTFHVFNHKLAKIYQNNFTLEGKDSKVSKIKVNDKTGILLVDCYTLKGKKATNSRLIKISKEDVIDLKIPNEFMYGYLHEISLSKEKFAVVSLASKNEGEILGISINLYKNSGELISSNFNKFSDQFIIDKYKKLVALKSKKVIYRLNFVEFDSDNNIYFAAQEFTRPSSMTMQNSVTGSYNSFNIPAVYDDILIGKISSTGELIFTRNIKNKMGKVNFEVFDDKFVVIAKGTTSSEKSKKFGDTTKPSLYHLEINNSGEITSTKKLVDYKKLEAPLNPNTNFKSIQSDNQKLLITRLGEEKNKRQYIKISN